MNFTDETEEDLRDLISSDFGPLPEAGLSREIVLNWMHYRARLIPPRQRVVVISKQVESSRASFPAIDHVRKALAFGEDVSPWLSERIRRRRSDPKADLMFNDWQISHFHLGRLFDQPNRVGPRHYGMPLLFAHISADRACLLDVQPHGAWSDQKLLHILRETSPQDMPDTGMMGGSGYSDEQLANLRKVGVTAPIHIDRKMYFPPGLGVASSGHALRLVVKCNHLMRQLQDLNRRLRENDLPIPIKMELLVLGRPIRIGLRLRFDGCLVLYEKSRALDLVTLTPFE